MFLSLEYEIEAMLQSGGGIIFNTASVAGLIAYPDMAPYVAAKHGGVGLASDLVGFNSGGVYTVDGGQTAR